MHKRKNMKFLIIGQGRFGRLLAQILSERKFEVVVLSSRALITPSGVVQGNWADVRNADIVIPAVPISQFESVIERIAPLMKAGSLCVDVCSVKEHPVNVMKMHLPQNVDILATHPMFGPDSFAENSGLKGLKVVLFPVRISPERLQNIKKFLEELELSLVEMTPEEHDQQVAKTQLYSFLVGEMSIQMNITATPVDTYWFKFFLKHKEVVSKDGEQLLKDIVLFNRYSRQSIEEFSNIATRLPAVLQNA